MTTMNLCLERLQNEFANASVEYELIDHAPAYSAQETAAAAHVSGYAFAKTTMLMIDGAPALFVVQAPYEVDFNAVRRRMRAREVRLARLEEFVGLFPDSEPGAMPPLPVPGRVDVYADRGLLTNDRIVFAAGTHTEAIRMPMQDYLLFASPEVFRFARPVTSARRLLSRRRPHAPLLAALAALGVAAVTPLIGQRRALRGAGVFFAGAAFGAAAATLADANSGPARRAVLRDRSAHYVRTGWRRARNRTRYSLGRSRGIGHWLLASGALVRRRQRRELRASVPEA
jgi:Ala-tRNA(Pro) deacylase